MRDLESIPIYEKFICVSKNGAVKARAVRENEGTVFVFSRGKKRYGKRYVNVSDFLNEYDIPDKEDETKKWHRRIRRVLKKIRKSGLWEEFIPVYENCLKMQWEDLKTLSDLRFGDIVDGKRVYDNEAISKMSEKYPFILIEGEDGKKTISFQYISGGIAECRTKSMYFGQYNNQYKEQIREHLRGEEKYIIPRLCVGYDVSFELDPEKGKAWYSEEYRGCGNGHYYIAIDADTAIFLEDD